MDEFTLMREGMRIRYNVPLEMSDGTVLRANLYFPAAEGTYPVIFNYGVYGKDLHFEEIYGSAWRQLLQSCPEVGVGSTNIHQAWEVVDPEKWCCDGYVCMRVDSRGAGCSPGFIDPYNPRETRDIYECIEWAGVQPWCNGKVGMNGISYYAVNSWIAAEAQPPHLAAIIAWEGYSDYYRDSCRHGGILNTSRMAWMRTQAAPVQYGRGVYGYKSRVTGKNVSGDETLDEAELMRNRADVRSALLANILDGEYYRERSVRDFSKIRVPVLSAGNWGGQGFHLRGNIEGFMRAASTEKYLEVHGYEHWTMFYSQQGMDLQKQFLGHYLKGEDTGWKKRRRVQLQIRHVDRFVERWEDEFPIARTEYRKLYLDPEYQTLSAAPSGASATASYRGLSSDGLTFLSKPFESETEITGYSMARLRISSSTADADIFLVMRVFSPDMAEVTFAGANDPHTPVAQGWLRASQRKLDAEMSTDFRPYHSHDEVQPLTPGEPVEMLVPMYPTCVVVPKGYRLALTVRGKDYVYPGADGSIRSSNVENPLTGCGPMLHNDPLDRPPAVFDGVVTLHFDPDNPLFFQIPVIPKK